MYDKEDLRDQINPMVQGGSNGSPLEGLTKKKSLDKRMNPAGTS